MRETARQPNDVARTLDRGLRVLDVLAQNPRGLTMAELAEALELHRTVVHRLLHTLAAHRLVNRDQYKRFRLAVGLVRLAEVVDCDLRSVALPLLEELAEATGTTAHLAVSEGSEVVVLATVEPLRADVHVAYRAGQSHPITRGSAGLAILAARPPESPEPDEVSEARARGYAVSFAEVLPNTFGVSAAVPADGVEASIGVSVFHEAKIREVGEHVRLTAQKIAERLR